MREGTVEAEKEPREPLAISRRCTVMVIKTVLHDEPTISKITEGNHLVLKIEMNGGRIEHGERKWWVAGIQIQRIIK